MANTFLFSNNAQTTLAGPISASATTLTVASGAGSLFPNPGAGQQFSVTLNDAATGLLYEIVYCTARTGDTMTVVRGQEGTTPLSWLAGDLAANVWTAGQAAGMVQSVALAPNRIVTASGAFTITTADANGSIGLNRTSALATSSSTLPFNAAAGQTYKIEDLASNFFPYPVTISAPGGMSIAGAASVILNVNKQSVMFEYYGSNIWSAGGLVA